MATDERNGLVRVSVRVTPEVMAELKRLADEDDRSLMNYTRRILEEHVATVKA